MQKFGISYGTIINIKKDFDRGIATWSERKILNWRQIMNSRLLNKLIERYVWITKHPFTSRDASTFLHKKHYIIIPPWLIRKMLKNWLRLSFKLGKSKPTNYDEVITLLMKCIFSIKIGK